MAGMADQFEALRRMAAFSAKLRGHELAVWRAREDSATAACAKCGRAITVYASVLQPRIEGPALHAECDATAAEEAA